MGRKIKRVGFGAQLSHGILFGVRHFEPDEVHEYYELHFCIIYNYTVLRSLTFFH